MEEELHRLPSKIIKRSINFHKKLHEIEAEIVQFTNLPTDTLSIDRLAAHIGTKLAFIRSLLSAELAPFSSVPDDLAEIEARLAELEAEFDRSNSIPNELHGNDDSESGSVCESCLNNDRGLQGESGSDVSSVYEESMLSDVVVQPPEVFRELVIPPSYHGFDCKREKTGGGKRRNRWCRTVAVFTTVSAVLTVSLSSYFDKKQRQGFLTPT